MRVRRSLGLGVALAAVLGGGCASGKEAQEERALLGAIDALRDAQADDLPSRRRLLEALEKHPATTPRAQVARDRCVSAYRLLIEGKEATESVRQGLAHPENAKPTLLSDLSRAEEKLKQSEEAMGPCEKAAGEMRLRPR